MLPRHHRWAVRSMSLVASYEEYWRPLQHHPARARLQALGRERDDVSYWITRNSIPNVIHAAGAIEHTVGQLEPVFEREQRAVDEYLATRPRGEDVPREWAGVERDTIQFEFSNLLFWLKALQERITSDARDENGPRQRIGLLNHHARDEPWTSSIRNLYGRLQQRIVLGNVHLANFVTHIPTRVAARVSMLQGPDPPPRSTQLGKLALRAQQSGADSVGLRRPGRSPH